MRDRDGRVAGGWKASGVPEAFAEITLWLDARRDQRLIE
jgi:hypothetical protein